MSKKLFIILFLLGVFLQHNLCFAKEWNSHRSSHFLVYYKKAPEDFIDEVIETAEEYYRSITSDLGFTRFDEWSWDERAKIYIYDDLDEYVKATNQPSWSGGSASYSEKRINTYPHASGFFDTLLPHELAHIIFREFVGLRTNLPLWLDEGVASCQEKAKRWGSAKVVKKAIADKKFIPLTELEKVSLRSSQDKDLVELFYAESANIVYFLLTEFNRYNFVDFCKALKEGKKFDEALHKGYPRFDNLEDLNRAWISYLENE
ncbi:MAG: peptidase MA family metallohydrolase [Candidatus Omnitrophota bacterium]|nr:peptidase MA family metallohydrolase [Candidatus Omnitrophota bacterium]